ncbi:hypothetical protein DPMN_155170 [Dreissena polymorpha]|uniref:Signal peptidase complex subunit 2 n=1 Tax=Dreissena polymorpha TaxID=45954 RepID=A0A9D4JB42_DREPO|nr:hypothetical protein DPMN_155170 [Dreissena polymorpha]
MSCFPKTRFNDSAFRYDDQYTLSMTYTDAASKKTRTSQITKSVASFFDENGVLCMYLYQPEVKMLKNNVSVSKKELQRLGTPYKFKGSPQSVVCVSHDTLCVTGGGGYKAVCLLSVSTDNTITLTREIKTSSKFDSLCCMSPSHMVVSTMDNPRPARMLSLDGVENDFDHVVFPTKTYKANESLCTYVQSKNTLVLTDRNAHTVFLYDTVKGTSRAVTNENIQEPCGCCVGPGDTVLVCSENNNSIVHLSVDGKILGIYPVDMLFPRSICVSKNATRLAVSNSPKDAKKLQMYNISPANS